MYDTEVQALKSGFRYAVGSQIYSKTHRLCLCMTAAVHEDDSHVEVSHWKWKWFPVYEALTITNRGRLVSYLRRQPFSYHFTCELRSTRNCFLIAFDSFVSSAEFLQENSEIVVDIGHVRSEAQRVTISRLRLGVAMLSI